MRESDALPISVTAAEGHLVMTLDGAPGATTMAIPPTHEGLLEMTRVLETLWGMGIEFRVRIHPDVDDESGIPVGYDVKGFVDSAYTLSQLGWYSSAGGRA